MRSTITSHYEITHSLLEAFDNDDVHGMLHIPTLCEKTCKIHAATSSFLLRINFLSSSLVTLIRRVEIYVKLCCVDLGAH